MTGIALGGFAEPGSGAVADALMATFEHGDLGASCALYVNGSHVVNQMMVTPEQDPRTKALMEAVGSCVNR